MKLIIIAFRNLRQRLAGFIAAAIAITLASTILLLAIGFWGGYDNALSSNVDDIGANILAIPKGCPYEATGVLLAGGNMKYTITQDKFDAALKVPGVKAVSGVIMGVRNVKGNGHDKGHVTLGVDDNYFKMRPQLGIKEILKPGEVIVGYFMHKNIPFKVGDELLLNGEKQKVVNFLPELDTANETSVVVDIKTAWRMLKADGYYSTIMIAVDDPAKSDEVAKKLSEIPDLQVVTMDDFQATVKDFVKGAQIAIMSVLAIILIIAGMGILTAQASSVAARKAEIGMMRAIGATSGQVVAMTAFESMITGLIGSAVGVTAGVLLAPVASNLIKSQLPQSPTGSIVVVTWLGAVLTVLAGMIIAVIAGLAPALSAAQTKPTEAAQDE
ncbi:MAG: ABC transporter permease [Caldisericia bacterium]|nr:ABC transporter permease [Caldisericia bacterium]